MENGGNAGRQVPRRQGGSKPEAARPGEGEEAVWFLGFAQPLSPTRVHQAAPRLPADGELPCPTDEECLFTCHLKP